MAVAGGELWDIGKALTAAVRVFKIFEEAMILHISWGCGEAKKNGDKNKKLYTQAVLVDPVVS
jgi:hypothetical protein